MALTDCAAAMTTAGLMGCLGCLTGACDAGLRIGGIRCLLRGLRRVLAKLGGPVLVLWQQELHSGMAVKVDMDLTRKDP